MNPLLEFNFNFYILSKPTLGRKLSNNFVWLDSAQLNAGTERTCNENKT